MARVTEFGNGIRPVWIWDITDRVGWGLRNRKADVQLVQILLNRLAPKMGLVDYRKPDGTITPMGRSFKPLAPLVVDGLMGNETAAAINSFVRIGQVTTDQAIDPVHPLLGRLLGDPISPRVVAAVGAIPRRTIFRMNTEHLRHYGKMLDENTFPEPLRSEALASKR